MEAASVVSRIFKQGGGMFSLWRRKPPERRKDAFR